MIGTEIAGKYRLERKLGEGGMGAVWTATQAPLGRRVAVKLIHASSTLGADARDRFEREARIVAGLRCPHVVTLFDFGEHEGEPYIVLELLDGETLRAKVDRGALPVDIALSITRDVACGLRSAHEAGVVHRDLKPENVMLVADRDRGVRAKLLDFGIARAIAPTEPRHTGHGMIVGTAGYIAPETLLTGACDDPRVDLYALGVMLFEMLTGRAPFEGPTPAALVVAHIGQPPPDVRDLSPGVPPHVAQLVGRLLAKKPEGRPASADVVVAEVDALRVGAAPTGGARTLQSAVTGVAARPFDRPSLAVQPFRAIGGTEDDAFFAEGVAEDILVALGRFKQLYVLGIATMTHPSARDTDPLRVGLALGVRYVVQGHVRRAGGRLRISVKLVDVETGAQVWAKSYDREAADLLELQDEITRSVTACVAGHVEAAHAQRTQKLPPQTLAAYDWVARGRVYHHRRTVEDNGRAREAIDRAIELDPDYAPAHAWQACAIGQAVGLGIALPGAGPDNFARILARAMELDDSDPECHRLGCELAFMQRDLAKAAYHHGRALALNPNDPRIVAQAGELATYAGDLDEAVAHLLLATRLDPLQQKGYLRLLVRTHYARGAADDAWALWQTISDEDPPFLAIGAAIAATRGDTERAQELAARVRAAAPKFSAAARTPPFADAERRERWLRGFAAVGL